MIEITSEIRKRLSDKSKAYWKEKKEHKNKRKLDFHLCTNCNKPFTYTKMIQDRLFRVTGTARIAGVYKKKGKIVEKVYAHYPSCKAQYLHPIAIRI